MSATSAYKISSFKPTTRTRRSPQWSNIKFLEDVNPWISNCISRIDELASLPQDWDSYGSNPTSGDARRAVLRFLANAPEGLVPEPSVSPVPGGGIGFHWRVEDRDLELEFLPDGKIEYLKIASTGALKDQPEEGILEPLTDKKLWYWLSGVRE